METSRLGRQIDAYNQWRKILIRTMDDYQAWLLEHELLTAEGERRIQACRERLNNDQLSVAFVAEFSRGKSELINAIFFADYGRRLLPSSAGRTTMCPTELLYDRKTESAYIRLLPIETRLQEAGLLELKQNPDSWVTYPLDLDSPDQIETCLREVVQTRHVSLGEAVRLGLFDPEQNPHLSSPARVEIPKWRHAIISFPHPLLKQGLTILDTPGLNALGSEPELTLNMLPSAQAVLFVLAADTGVTRSDLEMWQHHIKGFNRQRQEGLMVVLNKTDTLWDELQDEQAFHAAIEKQRATSAKILGIGVEATFPVSAQKGLLAKIKNDDELLQKSALPALEKYLSGTIINRRKEIIQDTIGAEISQMLENTISLVASRQKGIKAQFKELQGLTGKSQEVIQHMMSRARSEQESYTQDVNSFNTSRLTLKQQAARLHKRMDLPKLERVIEESHHRMSGNWTTRGLKNSMHQLFDGMRNDMKLLLKESEQARKLVRSIYRRFQSEHNFSLIQPRMFSIMRFRVELEMLHQEAEIFRNSPMMAMTEKHFVIRRFFIAIVGRARMIFSSARKEVDDWLNTVLDPLEIEIREHRSQMAARMQELQKISRSRSTLDQRIQELKLQYRAIEQQMIALRSLSNRLNAQHPSSDQEQQPKLVSNL